MKIYKWVTALSLYVTSTLAMAAANPLMSASGDPSSGLVQQIFQPPATDLSMSFLRMIFGSVGNVLYGSDTQILAQIFDIFNVGIMIVAGAFVTYTAVMATLSSSQDASPMGNKISVFVVLRIVLGTSMLVPVFVGYSAIQVVTMWFVVNGVGFADKIWDTTLDYINSKAFL